MSKSSRAVIQLVVALILSLATGLLVFRWLHNRPVEVQSTAPVIKTVEVVVASRDLHPGTLITGDSVKLVPFLEDSLPANSFRDPSDVEGRVVVEFIGTGEALSGKRLASDEVASAGVSAMLKDGMRAMAVQGNEVMGISGFIRPGNRVDVYMSFIPDNKPELAVTKVVLENMLVLATGTELRPSADGEGTSPVNVYTLEVSPEQGEKLALAANNGVLSFALRGGRDDGKVLTSGATLGSTLSSLRAGKKTARQRPKVEVITGGSRNTVRF